MTGRNRIGLAGARGVVGRLVVAAAILVPAGASAEEVQPPAQEAAAEGAPAAEQTFTPGIPGVKMADVRDYKHLWREIEELQTWERGDRISIAEYRSKVIEKTTQFLQLEGTAASEFAESASAAVAAIRESFLHRRGGDGTSGVEGQFSSDLEAAVTRMASLLHQEPRHQLFAPECKKWLLRLAFGPSEDKEAKQAQAAKSGGGGVGDTPGLP